MVNQTEIDRVYTALIAAGFSEEDAAAIITRIKKKLKKEKEAANG